MKLLMVLLVTGLLTGCGTNSVEVQSVENQIAIAKQNVEYAETEDLSSLEYNIVWSIESGDIIGFTDEMIVYRGTYAYAHELGDEEWDVCQPDEESIGDYCINTERLRKEIAVKREHLYALEVGDLQIYVEFRDLWTDEPVGVYDGKEVVFYK